MGVLARSLTSKWASPLTHLHYLKMSQEGFLESLYRKKMHVVGMGYCLENVSGRENRNQQVQGNRLDLFQQFQAPSPVRRMATMTLAPQPSWDYNHTISLNPVSSNKPTVALDVLR